MRAWCLAAREGGGGGGGGVLLVLMLVFVGGMFSFLFHFLNFFIFIYISFFNLAEVWGHGLWGRRRM